MRASTAAAILCLAAAVAPSVADTSTKAKNTARVTSEVNKTFGYELVKGVVAALIGTGVVTTFDIYAKPPKRRELFERFNERVNQELTAREYKREPLTTSLDNLD